MLRFFAIGFAAMLLAGCSQLGGLGQEPGRWQQWQQAQQQLASWDMHARAVVILQDGVYHVGLNWQRDSRGMILLIEAPFGQGVFRIESSATTPPIYQLFLPDGRILQNQSAEALLEQAIGWSIPISGLEFWVRGLPQPGSRYMHRSSTQARLKSIKQDGWTINYLDYFDQQESTSLPRRLQLLRDDITLKLVIERWQGGAGQSSPALEFPEFN